MAATATRRRRDGKSRRRRCLSLLFPRWGYDIWMRKNLIWIFFPPSLIRDIPPLMSVPPVKGEQRGAKDFFIAQFSLFGEGKEKVFPDISEENAFFALRKSPPNLISNPLKKRKRKNLHQKIDFLHFLIRSIGGWINVVNHTPEYIQLFSPVLQKPVLLRLFWVDFLYPRFTNSPFGNKKILQKITSSKRKKYKIGKTHVWFTYTYYQSEFMLNFERVLKITNSPFRSSCVMGPPPKRWRPSNSAPIHSFFFPSARFFALASPFSFSRKWKLGPPSSFGTVSKK